jgi:CRP/FNR family cyclic AMP-dependent transcriptional regulator
MSLVDGEPRSASVKAVTETEIVVLSNEGFAELGEHVPRLAFDLLSEIARHISLRLRRTSGELVQLIDSEE